MSSVSPPPATPPGPPRIGRLVAGLLLVLAGVGWLLEVLDVAELPLDVLLPAALILIGVALLATAGSGASHGGLIAAGIVLTVLLALDTAVDFPIGGGVGERTERPATEAALEDEYRLGIGQLRLDLSRLEEIDPSSPIKVRARVGIGQLVVVVPEGMVVRVEGKAAVGNVKLFDVEGAGFDVSRRYLTEPSGFALDLSLSVGIGQVEVRSG